MATLPKKVEVFIRLLPPGDQEEKLKTALSIERVVEHQIGVRTNDSLHGRCVFIHFPTDQVHRNYAAATYPVLVEIHLAPGYDESKMVTGIVSRIFRQLPWLRGKRGVSVSIIHPSGIRFFSS